MKANIAKFQVVTITLNPAIDRTVTISNFTAGAVNRVESVRSHPGGKGVNVASALADHGHGVAVTGFLGRSNAGAFECLARRKSPITLFASLDKRASGSRSPTVRAETTDINFRVPHQRRRSSACCAGKSRRSRRNGLLRAAFRPGLIENLPRHHRGLAPERP